MAEQWKEIKDENDRYRLGVSVLVVLRVVAIRVAVAEVDGSGSARDRLSLSALAGAQRVDPVAVCLSGDAVRSESGRDEGARVGQEVRLAVDLVELGRVRCKVSVGKFTVVR